MVVVVVELRLVTVRCLVLPEALKGRNLHCRSNFTYISLIPLVLFLFALSHIVLLPPTFHTAQIRQIRTTGNTRLSIQLVGFLWCGEL